MVFLHNRDLAKAGYLVTFTPLPQLKLWASQEEVNLNSINPAVRFSGMCLRSVETTDRTEMLSSGSYVGLENGIR